MGKGLCHPVTIAGFLASRRFTALLLLACIVSMILATYHEVLTSPAEALHTYYASTWFELLLGLLGVNILFSLISRFPWKLSQIPFMVSHTAILAILIGAFITKHHAITGMVAIPEGRTINAIGLPHHEISIKGESTVIAQEPVPTPLFYNRLPTLDPPLPSIEAEGVTFTFTDYWPDTHKTVTAEAAEPPAPAVADLLLKHTDEQLPIMVTEDGGAMLGLLQLRLNHIDQEPPEDLRGPAVTVLFNDNEQLRIRFLGDNGARSELPCTVGESVMSPWSSLTFTVTKFWRHATKRYGIEPAVPEDEERNPAIRITAQKGQDKQKFWLKRNTPYTLQPPLPGLILQFTNAVYPLGFDVSLESFEIDYYPDSSMPRSYESRIGFPGNDHTETIRLNYPVTHDDWSFFQADYIMEENQPPISILSAARDPGKPIVFAGYIGLLIGMILVIFQTKKLSFRKAAPAAVSILLFCLLCAASPDSSSSPDGTNEFRTAWIFMLIGLILCLLTIRKPDKPCFPVGITFCLVATAILSWGLWIRWETAGRFPAANMYESLLFLGWGSGIFILIALLLRECLACITAAAIGTLSLLLADVLPINHEIGPVAPILLDTPWMALHVPVTMAAYAVLALATLIAHIQLIRLALDTRNVELEEKLHLLLKRYILVGTCLLATGIITGSMWASVSWGRYWGWDPKEVWSLIACFGFLIIIHLRAMAFTTALLTTVAFWTIMMTYLGVNFVLKTGLHSYATDTGSVTFWLKLAALVDVMYILVCSLFVLTRKTGETIPPQTS